MFFKQEEWCKIVTTESPDPQTKKSDIAPPPMGGVGPDNFGQPRTFHGVGWPRTLNNSLYLLDNLPQAGNFRKGKICGTPKTSNSFSLMSTHSIVCVLRWTGMGRAQGVASQNKPSGG